MGGFCTTSRKFTIDGVALDDAPSESSRHANGHSNSESEMVSQSHGVAGNANSHSTSPPVNDGIEKQLWQSFSVPGQKISCGPSAEDINDEIPHLSRVSSHKSKSTKSRQAAAVTKVSEVSSLLSRAGTAGLGKAVDVLDTLGSSVTNLNLNNGFTSGVATKGNKISILAFEVANTIFRGANLMQSLSKESIRHLKEAVLPSVAVKNLISRDKNELLRIAAEDKREELKIFSGEVVRFANRCKDPQWHNLDRYFEMLGSELAPPQKQLKEDAEIVMQQLMTLVQHTAELYHELHALDRFEQDYRHRLQEEDNSSTTQKGKSLAILRAELKSQKKHVRNLKKKSLWSKILEEVMEKLVDIVHFLHLRIHEAFDTEGQVKDSQDSHKKLGSAGLSLHYANIISQIDTLASRSSSVPPNLRDALYQGLPPNVKSALRPRLQSFQVKEELTVPLIKAEMEKTLQWLIPIATNTTKAHHGFGWVGEWANTGPAGRTDLLRIETLHHANKEKTEVYILELVVWLHLLVSQATIGNGGIRSPMKSPIHSPNQKMEQLFSQKACSTSPTLTVEDQQMLRDVSERKLTPGISKSQEFGTTKTGLSRNHRLSKSRSHSPTSETKNDIFFIRRSSSIPVINFDIDRIKALDMIDRVDTI